MKCPISSGSSLFAIVHIKETQVHKGLKQGQHLKMLFSGNLSDTWSKKNLEHFFLISGRPSKGFTLLQRGIKNRPKQSND